jgi:hypothetical protein
MTDSPMVFEEKIAPAVAAQQARGLAEWLRTCVGLVAPVSSAAPSGRTLRQQLHTEQHPTLAWRKVSNPEDDVRQHFRNALKHILQEGPLGTDFVLCAVGRMAEDILSIGRDEERDSQFHSEWTEYARWILPGFTGTIAP